MRIPVLVTVTACGLVLAGAPAAAGPVAVSAQVRPLGVVEQIDPTTVRISGCLGVSRPVMARLRIDQPTTHARGVVLLFSGGGGSTFWADHSQVAAQAVLDMRAAGFRVVQVAWQTAWLASAPGERSGPHALACRPATLINWAHRRFYAPLGLDPPAGVCGFCVSGNSGGASQISYTLSFYGQENILDAVIPTGGPPHASLDKGCLRRPGEDSYYYTTGNAQTIDSSYGFVAEPGPCALHDTALTSRWIADSVQAGDLDYPASRVHIIGNGTGIAEVHGFDYFTAITSTRKTNEVIPWLPHGVMNHPDGTAAILRALQQN